VAVQQPVWGDSLHRRKLGFVVILSAYILYAALFIYRTSFVIDGRRYFSLFDDAMVSMRYARNLAQGYGLVWNPGGPAVEGYTNPLWVIYMAAWHLLPIAATNPSLIIQITGAVCLALNLIWVARLARLLAPRAAWVVGGAVGLTALYLPLNTWALLGTEVSVLTLLMSIATWQALQILISGRSPGTLYLLLGIGTLVRMDMVVPFVAFLLFLFVADKQNRKRHLLYGAGILILFLAVQTGFRLTYYGDVLPNTYYLKLTGYPLVPRIAWGALMFLKFAYFMNFVLFLLPLYVLTFRRDKTVLLLCWLFCVQVAYSIYVGGDAWERWGGSNRYFSPVMPLFMIMMCYGIWSYLERIRAGLVSLPISAATIRQLINLTILFVLLIVTAVFSGAGSMEERLTWAGASIAILGLLVSVAVLWYRVRQPGASKLQFTTRGAKSAANFSMGILLVLTLINLNAIHRPGASDEWLLQAPAINTSENAIMVRRALLSRPNHPPLGAGCGGLGWRDSLLRRSRDARFAWQERRSNCA
jgi:hypothetical protein